MAGHKITRKEMKRDELVTTLSDLSAAIDRHGRSLAIAAGAIVLLAAAVAGGLWYSHNREKAAGAALGRVHRAISAPVVDAPVAPGAAAYASSRQKYEEIMRLASAVIDEYPSSTAAKWATYWKAVGEKELGQHQAALATLAPLAAQQQEEFLSASARVMQAMVQEASGDLPAAVQTYAALADSAPKRFPVELALMSQARLLEAQGKSEEALAVYRRITQEHPESPLAREAGLRLAPNRS